MADFSSRGPAEDGRIKPDITAPGTWIASLKSQLASDANAWLGIDENYLFQGAPPRRVRISAEPARCLCSGTGRLKVDSPHRPL